MTAPAKILLVVLVVAAAVFDLKSRRIPNWLTAAGLLCGFTLQLILSRRLSANWSGLREASLGMGLALLVYLPLYALRAVGGGDVKLMAAVGSVAGPSAWLAIFCVTAITGGAIALLLVIARGRLGRTLQNTGIILNELAHGRAPYHAREELDVSSARGVRLPHGCTIAIGSLLYLLY